MELSATFLFAVLKVVGKAQRFLKSTLILTMYSTSHKKSLCSTPVRTGTGTGAHTGVDVNFL